MAECRQLELDTEVGHDRLHLRDVAGAGRQFGQRLVVPLQPGRRDDRDDPRLLLERVLEGVHHVAWQEQVVPVRQHERLAREHHLEPPGQADERLVLAGVDVRRRPARAARDGVLEQRVRTTGGATVRLRRDAEPDRADLLACARGQHVTAAECHPRLL
jgi:hypothetical protein